MRIKSCFMTLVLSLLSLHVHCATKRYVFTDLGTLGGSSSEAFDINNAGQVVGWSYDERNSGTRPTLWSGGAISSLGDLGTAYAINEKGMIAGTSSTDDQAPRPTIWTTTGAAMRLQIGGATTGEARAINDYGIVSGYVRSGTWPYQARQATGWDAATKEMNAFPAWATAIFGINAAGATVGEASNQQAIVCDKGECTTLPTLGGVAARGNAISDNGIIVGYSYDARNVMRATSWAEGKAIDLGSLTGDYAIANAVNNGGEVVGYSVNGSWGFSAVLWQAGVGIVDLNTLLESAVLDSGWRLTEASGINDLGWIVGNATSIHTGETHAFMLTPVPEPSAYLMLLTGAGVLGVIRRRREARSN